ncbi:MAG: AsmA family protein [Deltaproteobacteria bacterium]|nr:AsmA family protein [Deltaproteobacteria bacterium]
MSKSLKIILFAIAGVIALFILISVALFFFGDTSVFKPRLERAASEALGMEVRVNGRLRMTLFPDVRVRLADVQIRNRGVEIASARAIHVDVALRPLLRREVRIQKITFQSPVISVKQELSGKFNFERREKAQRGVPALILDRLSFSDGTLLYEDEKSGNKYEVLNFNLDVRDLRISGGNGSEPMKSLFFLADFACPEIRTKSLVFSDVKFTCKGSDGVFTFDPVGLRLFGGQGSGRIEADLSEPVPRYLVRASLSKLRIEEYLKTLSPKNVAEGPMDFSAELTLRGKTVKEIVRSAGGEVTLRGENLQLFGTDVDRKFAQYESSQNFNLFDIGAFFVAGPIGLAFTKGYDFANVLQGSGGSSRIGKFFSAWKVERGVAQARDVAMATRHYRVALKGRIDFVDQRFEEVTLAVVDARGCARLQQKIRGPFRKPVVEKPNALISLAGPALNLLRQAEEFLDGGKCEAFYNGSVPAPK